MLTFLFVWGVLTFGLVALVGTVVGLFELVDYLEGKLKWPSYICSTLLVIGGSAIICFVLTLVAYLSNK